MADIHLKPLDVRLPLRGAGGETEHLTVSVEFSDEPLELSLDEAPPGRWFRLLRGRDELDESSQSAARAALLTQFGIPVNGPDSLYQRAIVRSSSVPRGEYAVLAGVDRHKAPWISLEDFVLDCGQYSPQITRQVLIGIKRLAYLMRMRGLAFAGEPKCIVDPTKGTVLIDNPEVIVVTDWALLRIANAFRKRVLPLDSVSATGILIEDFSLADFPIDIVEADKSLVGLVRITLFHSGMSMRFNGAETAAAAALSMRNMMARRGLADKVAMFADDLFFIFQNYLSSFGPEGLGTFAREMLTSIMERAGPMEAILKYDAADCIARARTERTTTLDEHWREWARRYRVVYNLPANQSGGGGTLTRPGPCSFMPLDPGPLAIGVFGPMSAVMMPLCSVGKF